MFDRDRYQSTFDQVRISKEIRERVIQFADTKPVHSSKNLKFLLVAVIGSLFLLSAYTYIFRVYNDPAMMLEGIVGENGRSTYAAEKVDITGLHYGGGSRSALDMELAKKYIAPHIYEVNQTVVAGDQVLTVEACIADKASLTGAIYYRLENPPQYHLSNRGAITWLNDEQEWDPLILVEMDRCNAIGNHMIVEAMTTENVLYATYQFVLEADCDWMRLMMADGQDEIIIPFPEDIQMDYLKLDNGGIILSPFGAALDAEKYGMNFRTLDCISIFYDDGEEYELHWEDRDGEKNGLEDSRYGCNVSFFSDSGKVVYVFSRVLDIENVHSIVINGTEYKVS